MPCPNQIGYDGQLFFVAVHDTFAVHMLISSMYFRDFARPSKSLHGKGLIYKPSEGHIGGLL